MNRKVSADAGTFPLTLGKGEETMEITPIARIHNCYTGKFGIPRQSGLADAVVSEIVFEKDFQSEEAFREIEGFSHLWLLWIFSENVERGWSLTVRPPKLGGNKRIGVFATRSPFRPNPIGLSCVRLQEVLHTEDRGTVLRVSGADLMDGTPIVDIKPYIPYTDAHTEALSGFVPVPEDIRLQVETDCPFPEDMMEESRKNLMMILSEDPRPAYQKDEERVYGMNFEKWNVRFKVIQDTVHIIEIEVMASITHHLRSGGLEPSPG